MQRGFIGVSANEMRAATALKSVTLMLSKLLILSGLLNCPVGDFLLPHSWKYTPPCKTTSYIAARDFEWLSFPV